MAKRWYSVSVLSNFEKKVAEQIRTKVAEHLCRPGSGEYPRQVEYTDMGQCARERWVFHGFRHSCVVASERTAVDCR